MAFHLSLSLFFCIQNAFIRMVFHSSWYRVLSVLLLSEGASFWKIVFPHSLAEDRRAANTQNYCLRMAKNGGDCIASWAFHIHKIGTRHFFLCFLFWRGMKEILGERHVLMGRSSPPERASSLFLSQTTSILKTLKQLRSIFCHRSLHSTDPLAGWGQ